MNIRQIHALTIRETDIDGVMRRLSGNEAVYKICLWDFLEDPTIKDLNSSIKAGQWDDAFTAAHALKGVAGNMGFVPLMHSVGQLVVVIRSGRLSEIDDALELVNSNYRDIIDGIHQYFNADEGEKE